MLPWISHDLQGKGLLGQGLTRSKFDSPAAHAGSSVYWGISIVMGVFQNGWSWMVYFMENPSTNG